MLWPMFVWFFQFPNSASQEMDFGHIPGGFVSPERLHSLVKGVLEWMPEFGVCGSSGFGAVNSPSWWMGACPVLSSTIPEEFAFLDVTRVTSVGLQGGASIRGMYRDARLKVRS